MNSPLIEVGRIVRPHGLRGQVVVELTTDRDERLAPGSQLTAGDRGMLVVASATRQRPATERRRARWIVRFEGHTSVEDAESWRDVVLQAEPLEDPDALWVHDLVGAEVVLAGSGESVGSCVSVVANPAADLLELEDGSLVPVVFVVDRSEGRVVIDPPPGLFEL